MDKIYADSKVRKHKVYNQFWKKKRKAKRIERKKWKQRK